jgi:hypothetical protein
MKREKEQPGVLARSKENNLKFREIGKGFIMSPVNDDMPVGDALLPPMPISQQIAYPDEWHI